MAPHCLSSMETGCRLDSTHHSEPHKYFPHTDRHASVLIGWADNDCHLHVLYSHTDQSLQSLAQCSDAAGAKIEIRYHKNCWSELIRHVTRRISLSASSPPFIITGNRGNINLTNSAKLPANNKHKWWIFLHNWRWNKQTNVRSVN